MVTEGWKKRTTDVIRRHRPDYLIVLYMGILMLLGLIIMYAIGPQRANVLNNAYGGDYTDSYFFIKQSVSLVLALVAFGLATIMPHKLLLKQGSKILAVGLIACTVLAVAGWAGWSIAQESYGATRWFNLGIVGTFQPAELLKLGLLAYLAAFLGVRAKQGKINDLKETLIPIGLITGLTLLFVVVLQRDLGTGISITAIVMSMLFVAGMSKKVGLAVLGILLLVGAVFILSAPHRLERVATYLQGDTTTTQDAGAYHIQHAKIAIGSGGFFGVGIGNSVQATGYLPEAINDSVFAIMGETFGFVGLVAVIALFIALLTRLLKTMDHLLDLGAKLFVAGVFGWLAAHVILNIAAMIGIFPLTGITLPLLSFGGTSIIFIAIALGFVFQLSRYTSHPSRVKEGMYENSGGRRRVRRTRDAGGRGFKRD